MRAALDFAKLMPWGTLDQALEKLAFILYFCRH